MLRVVTVNQERGPIMAYQGNHPLDAITLGNRDVRRVLHRHAALERKLDEAMAGPVVDWDGVKLLKREKLRLSEQLQRLRSIKHLN